MRSSLDRRTLRYDIVPLTGAAATGADEAIGTALADAEAEAIGAEATDADATGIDATLATWRRARVLIGAK